MEQAVTIAVTTSTLFGVIFALLLYIWNKAQKNNDERLLKHEQLIEELTKNTLEQKVILTELAVIVKYHERDLKKE